MPFKAEEKGSQGNGLWKGGEQGMITLSCDPNTGQRQTGARTRSYLKQKERDGVGGEWLK